MVMIRLASFLLLLAWTPAPSSKPERRHMLRDLVGCLYAMEFYEDTQCWGQVQPHCQALAELLPAGNPARDLCALARPTAPFDDWRAKLVTSFQATTAPRMPANRQQGAVLYAQHCHSCHGSEGDNGPLAARFSANALHSFTDHHLRAKRTAAMVHHVIADGRTPKGMPSFKGFLTIDQMWDISHFTLSLGRLPPPPVTGHNVLNLKIIVQTNQSQLQQWLHTAGVCTPADTCPKLAASWHVHGPYLGNIQREER